MADIVEKPEVFNGEMSDKAIETSNKIFDLFRNNELDFNDGLNVLFFTLSRAVDGNPDNIKDVECYIHGKKFTITTPHHDTKH